MYTAVQKKALREREETTLMAIKFGSDPPMHMPVQNTMTIDGCASLFIVKHLVRMSVYITVAITQYTPQSTVSLGKDQAGHAAGICEEREAGVYGSLCQRHARNSKFLEQSRRMR
jgi:hypothetical protein